MYISFLYLKKKYRKLTTLKRKLCLDFSSIGCINKGVILFQLTKL